MVRARAPAARMADLSDAVEALYADDASALIAAYKGGGSSVKVSDGKLGAAPVGRLAWVEATLRCTWRCATSAGTRSARSSPTWVPTR